MGRGVLAALAAALVLAAPARAAYPACTAHADHQHTALTQPAKSTAQSITVLSPSGSTYKADLFAPEPLPPADSSAPAAVVMHGIGADPCSVRWAARVLAAHGYFVVSPYRPPTPHPPADKTQEVLKHVDAEKAALAYIRSPVEDKFARWIDLKDVSVVGHSLGASAAAVLQGSDTQLKTIVALDGLRHWGAQDPGLPFDCAKPRGLLIRPRIPALGLASEAICATAATPPNPDLRKTGWTRWRKFGVPAVVVALKGFAHTDFAAAGSTAQLRKVTRIMLPWLDHYQRGTGSVPFTGVPDAWMSTTFRSAAFLPSPPFATALDCGDLLACGP